MQFIHLSSNTLRKVTRKSLHKKLWDRQSLRIRKSAANFQDLVQCYTCSKFINYKEAQLGHFWHNKLDFDERNLRIQCIYCNHYKHGNLGKYAKRLIMENGLDWFNQLEADAAQHKGYTLTDLKKYEKN